MAQTYFISLSVIEVDKNKPLKYKILIMHFLIIMSHTNARYRSEENSPAARAPAADETAPPPTQVEPRRSARVAKRNQAATTGRRPSSK